MGTDCQIDRFLTEFTGKMLQIRLKTHQLITKANFCAFYGQGEIFKLLILKLIYKCTSYNIHYVKWKQTTSKKIGIV
ncbi:hypothetical protein DWA11_15665 [Acinetobacter baumannii]|nr:hypothetical protein DV997_17395 [Acinetobacter baumannii]TDI05618.1 hypothetical protein DWA11_15665 [Acinetobacter baumannii]TDI24615.1 hypothetical protein DWA21_13450 [Acinetobacter baumannii]TPU60777.1 hypothetical protein FJU37_18405 [Acinetobacter baumannii]